MLKCLIERPAQHIVTAASGPRSEALALVSQTQSYLHFERCIWMTSIEPSRLWETRAGYREIPIEIRAVDVMAGGGGGAGPAPTSRARYTGRNMHNYDIYTKISVAPYPVCGVCTLAVQWECMQTVCRRSRVRNPFAFFSNLNQHTYELVCTGMYSYVPVCTSMYQYVCVHTGMY